MTSGVCVGDEINLVCSSTNTQSSDNISINNSVTKYYVNIVNQTYLYIRNSLSSSTESLKVNVMNSSLITAKSEVVCVDCFYIREVSIDRLSGDISINQSLNSKDGTKGFVYSLGTCKPSEIKKPKF